MAHELDIIPDYNIVREVSDWPKEFFLKVAETSLTRVVRFVEEPADDDLAAAQRFLEAAAGATPGPSKAERDFRIVAEHLGPILAGLARGVQPLPGVLCRGAAWSLRRSCDARLQSILTRGMKIPGAKGRRVETEAEHQPEFDAEERTEIRNPIPIAAKQIRCYWREALP